MSKVLCLCTLDACHVMLFFLNIYLNFLGSREIKKSIHWALFKSNISIAKTLSNTRALSDTIFMCDIYIGMLVILQNWSPLRHPNIKYFTQRSSTHSIIEPLDDPRSVLLQQPVWPMLVYNLRFSHHLHTNQCWNVSCLCHAHNWLWIVLIINEINSCIEINLFI